MYRVITFLQEKNQFDFESVVTGPSDRQVAAGGEGGAPWPEQRNGWVADQEEKNI